MTMDIISLLSDDLLSRILSYVPTKDVASTSLVSKRWQPLWMLMPKLDYDDTDHIGDYKIFSEFVYRSLLSNKAPVLEKLHLNLGPDCPAIDIRLWIDLAVTRRVSELDLAIRFPSIEGSVSLPSSLYTSDTLETLILGGYLLLNAPLSVCLPSLKNLILELVDYIDDKTLPRLLSGCPNLEELFVERHTHEPMEDFVVVVPSVQKLTLSDKSNVSGKRNVINAPSLKYLNITDEVDYDVRQIKKMPELVEAYVDITQTINPKFLSALTSVRRLSLCLSLSKVTHPSGMIFHHLVHLELCTITEGWWDLLTLMLQDSPKLQTLKLHDKHDGDDSAVAAPYGWKRPSSVPECLLSSLEIFEWIGYEGRLADIIIAAYIEKNAACLKTVTLSPGSTDLGERYGMLDMLASVATT